MKRVIHMELQQYWQKNLGHNRIYKLRNGYGLQFIGQYQYKDSKKGAAGSQKDNALQLRMIFIY